MTQVLAGLRKQFVNNFVFPIWASAAGLNNKNNNNRNNNGSQFSITRFDLLFHTSSTS